jgi:RNA polymerase primary sigma factor
MEQEILFAKTLEEVKSTAKEQGNCIRKEQVEEAFAELKLNEQQMEMVYDYLEKHKIGIGEPVDLDEYLTDKEKNYLQNYLDELEQLPEYTDGEKHAYTIAAMAGETDAQKKLTEMYLKNVVDVAKLYSGQGVFLEDLIGEGNLALTFGTGMLGSLEKPEEADGMLIKLVMDAMEEFIAENADSDKINKKALERVNKVLDKAKELAEAIGRNVTVAELAEETGLSEKAIRDAMRISGYKIDYIEG